MLVALATGMLVLLGCAGSETPGPQERPLAISSSPGRPTGVVLVSVSGLEARHLRPGSPLPTLASLAAQGAVADVVVPVAPSTVYPAHTTLVTGRLPAEHGVVADVRLGDHGVERERYAQADAIDGTPLWRAAAEGGLVVSLDWPATVGAQVAMLLPDLVPDFARRRADLLQGQTTSRFVELAADAGLDLGVPSAERDAFLVDMACLSTTAAPPRLLLLHLTQAQPAAFESGSGSAAAESALLRVDADIARLLRCLQDEGHLARLAIAVTGAHPFEPVHSLVRGNVVLADAGLITLESAGITSWRALLRSNGTSAFLYARDADAAIAARDVLREAAGSTAAFDLVSAKQMIAIGADPEAWFALRAHPGYAFADAAIGPRVSASPVRGAGGALEAGANWAATGASPGFVLVGRGVRRGLRVPELRQLDVAPTLARLLGIELPDASGTPLVGLLALDADTPERLQPPAAAPGPPGAQSRSPADRPPAPPEDPGQPPAGSKWRVEVIQ